MEDISKNKNIRKLPIHQRLFSHQTKSSVNHSVYCSKNDVKHSPADSLDIYLTSIYNHETDLFVDKCDIVFQEQTNGQKTYPSISEDEDKPGQLNCFGHPLVIGNFLT